MVGCVNVLPQPGAAPKRVTLHPDISTFNPPQTSLSTVPNKKALTIAMPSGGDSLDSTRIRVVILDKGVHLIDALAGVEWHEPLPAMVQESLVKAFEVSKKYAAVGGQRSHFLQELLLETDIRSFDLVLGKGTDQAIITLHIRLIDGATRKVLRQETFTAKVSIKARTLEGVMTALNQAFTTVLDQLVKALK